MKLTGKLSSMFIPTFLKNQELPQSEQIKVELKYPTHEQREILQSEISYVQRKSGTEVKVKTNHAQIIDLCVGKITNLETEEDGVIADGKALLQARDPRLEPLLNELVVEVKRHTLLSEEDEKNSV